LTDLITRPINAQPPPPQPAVEKPLMEVSKWEQMQELANATPGDQPGSDLDLAEATKLTRKRRELSGADPFAQPP
jgi:hypothetical protein